ncbi:MAG TPA: type 1 glutamine amidotransferase domain-containing protein [Dongiaceae bacterium]|nr:type 1 glutamine amidotransferase domain-containing protein [Dongiaceae bacterium]
MASLKGVRVAILATGGFEQDELMKPRQALNEAGAETTVVSPNGGEIRGWKHTEWGDRISVDESLKNVAPEHFDALLLPGGVISPDKLRMEPKAVQFVRSFFNAGKPVAAICHGPWSVIEAGAAYGRRIASWPSLKTDLRNAGAEWIDEEAVIDRNLVSARKPDDIPAFNKAMIELFASSKERGATLRAPGTPSGISEHNGDAQVHARRIKQMLDDLATHAREDSHKISDPKAQALFETTSETLHGLMKAYSHYEEHGERQGAEFERH